MDVNPQLDLDTRSGWPTDVRTLIEAYPREIWPAHTNLGDMTQFWLSRHALFRQMATELTDISEAFREQHLTVAGFLEMFGPRLSVFLGNLDEHHNVEDHYYFPKLRQADQRLERGFEVLESDHQVIHQRISATYDSAVALMSVLQTSAARADREAEAYVTISTLLLGNLKRHLEDEEDLIVPLILDRGETGLGLTGV